MTDPGTGSDPIELARPIRPQEYGRGRVDHLQRPVVEPAWMGLRVIVGSRGDAAAIYDDGRSIEDEARIVSRLTGMIAHTANGAVLDGYLTKQATADDLPIAFDRDIPTTGELMAKPLFGIRRDRKAERIRRLDADEEARTFGPEDIVNFVATDLLWLDGEWLLDVPLLERKRLLEAIIPGDDLVRAGPYVQPPYEVWMGSWRSQGFTSVTFKEGNSHYHPGEVSDEWLRADLRRR